MAIYIYKISTSYHNNKEWVAGFIKNHKNNHQDGNWYFIHQKEEFSLYKLPDGEIHTYTDDDFKYSYDEEEEGYGTTLVQTRDSEIENYMIDFESNYLTHLSEMDRFQLQAIYPFGDGSGNEFFAMDVYSENTYDEGFYGSGFQDHSWTNKEGGLDDYFEGDIKISDVVSKIMDKWKYLHKLEKKWKQAKQNIIDIFMEKDDLDKYFEDYDQNKKDKRWSLLLSGGWSTFMTQAKKNTLLTFQNIPQWKVFKNLAKQGSFGEMIYSMFLEKHNIKFEKVNDKATDFLLYISDKMIRIDVKCSLSKKVWHNKNKEVKHLGIKYDVVFLDTKKNKATLFPDKNSPFYEKYYDYELGDIDDFEKKFSRHRLTKKPIKKDNNKTNVKAEYKSYIKSELTDKTFDFDFLYRTAQTYKFHKNDPPHNVPGKTLDKKSIIFSNMILDGERKKPGKSYILFSSEYKKYPYTGPTRNYHIKKGIEKLIDWSKFEELFSQNCHDNLEDLIYFLNTRNSWVIHATRPQYFQTPQK